MIRGVRPKKAKKRKVVKLKGKPARKAKPKRRRASLFAKRKRVKAKRRVAAKPKAKAKAKPKRTPQKTPTRPTAKLVAATNWDLAGEVSRRIELEQAVASDRIEGDRLIAVLIPVLGRPGNVRTLVESFRNATSPADAQLYFIAQTSDGEEIAAIRDVGFEPLLVPDVERSWARKINHGYLCTEEPWLLLGADDLAFHAGWIDVVRSLLGWFPGVVGTNDLGNRSTIEGVHSTHPLVRRRYADICGTVDQRPMLVHEGYDHNYPDTELCATARKRGLYVHRSDCIIEHLHPAWGKAKTDPIYQLGQRRVRQDGQLFAARGRRFGFL